MKNVSWSNMVHSKLNAALSIQATDIFTWQVWIFEVYICEDTPPKTRQREKGPDQKKEKIKTTEHITVNQQQEHIFPS